MIRFPLLCFALLGMFTLLQAETPKFEPDPDLPDGTKVATEAISTFRYPKGFKIELFAAEPMLASPVAICLDEKNRVFVAEEYRFNRGTEENRTRPFMLEDDLKIQTVEDRLKMYQRHAKNFEGGMNWFSKKSDQIRLLEDRTGSGKANYTSIFADGFNHPLDGLAAGLLAHEGDLYFTCIPSLWKLKDTKNTGKADVRESIHRGFGVNCAFLGHDLHGLILGPDGKLYFSVGDRGFHVETKEGKTLHGPRTGGVFRCDLDGKNLECIYRGLRNPQELAFDQFGNLFADDNNCDKGDHARLVYILDDGDSGWNMAYQTIPEPYMGGPWFAERLWHLPHAGQPAWITPCIGKIGAGPSGFVFNGGVAFPQEFRHQFFMCNYTGNGGIEMFGVKPKGAGFEMTETKDFLKPIRATDCDFGYDGKMYVSDFVNLDWSGKSLGGRIYTLFDPEKLKDETVREVKQLFEEGFKQRGKPELAKLLNHADQRVRLRAQYALAEKDGEAEFLEILKGSTNQLARIHALWGLGQLGRKNPKLLESIAKILEDSDEELQAQAARILNDQPYPQSERRLRKLLETSQNSRVLSFAALATGRLKESKSVAALVKILEKNNNQDPWLRHCVVTALARIGEVGALAENDELPSPAVRLGVVLVYRKLAKPSVSRFLNDPNLDVANEAARAIHDLPIESEFPALAASLSRFKINISYEAEPLIRRGLDAHLRIGDEANFKSVAEVVLNPNFPLTMRAEALACLAEWAKPGPRDRVTGFWNPIKPRETTWLKTTLEKLAPDLLSKTTGNLQTNVINLLIDAKVTVDEKQFVDWINDPNGNGSSRIAALNYLQRTQSKQFKTSLEVALKDQLPALRASAMEHLLALEPTRSMEMIASAISDAKSSLVAKQLALETLTRRKPKEASKLLDELAEKLATNQIAPELALDVMDTVRANASGARQNLLSKFETKINADPFGKFQVSLVGGNPEKGRELFTGHAAAQCIRCHAINGSGGNAGPELSGLTKRYPEKTREYVLESLIRPDAKIAPGFGSIRVVTFDGKVIAGTLQGEDAKTLQLTTPEGQKLTLNKEDIESQSKPTSAMPSLERTLSPREMRDLVAFLMTLK
jgi:quinoprotein glucose dehydrogenase